MREVSHITYTDQNGELFGILPPCKEAKKA